MLSSERQELLSLYKGRLTEKALDAAVQTRPLALALGGGGGTSFIFTGAFAAFEEAGIIPDAMAGSSMGAIIGLYRAKTKHFDLEDLKRVATPLVWSRITQILSRAVGLVYQRLLDLICMVYLDLNLKKTAEQCICAI